MGKRGERMAKAYWTSGGIWTETFGFAFKIDKTKIHKAMTAMNYP